MAISPRPQLISITEAADRCHTSYWTIRRRIADGSLHAWRMTGGRTIRLDAAEVDNLLRPVPAVGGDYVA